MTNALKDWENNIRAGGRAAGLNPLVERFFFLRHGQTDHNLNGVVQGWMDIPLNATGLVQAETAAVALAGRGITAIVSSTLSRALRTAEIVSAAIGAPVAGTDARLRERFFGQYENHPAPEPSTWTRDDNGSETNHEFGVRTAHGLNAALAEGCPLIVAHGGTRRVLLLTLGIDEPGAAYGNAAPLEFVRVGGTWTMNLLAAGGEATRSDA